VWPNASVFELIHGCVGKFGLRAVTADHKHEDRILTVWTERNTFEPPDGAWRKRNHIEWIKIN
jgi:hypothetical protein